MNHGACAAALAIGILGLSVTAAPVPKQVAKPMPDGLAGEWVIQRETFYTPNSQINTQATIQKGAAVDLWSFDGDRLRLYTARLDENLSIDEKSKKEVRAYRLAWDKAEPDLLRYELLTPEPTNDPPARV